MKVQRRYLLKNLLQHKITMLNNIKFAVMGVVLLVSLGQEISVAENLEIVTFKVDVTPLVGERLAYVFNEKIETPIYVNGIVLNDGETRAVWVSCDYLYLCGEIHVAWTDEIAKQAGVPRENVFLHSVHQHDSMWMAPGYNPTEDENWGMVVNPEYCDKSLKDVSEAVAKAISGPWQTVGKLLTSETRVGGLAANRRLVDENGQFAYTRFSGVNPLAVQARPVGRIDPILRTICFENVEGRRIVALHFYATHPMAAYRRNMVSTDVPGWALRHVAENDDSVEQNIYFSGCGGDITFGKYNLTGDLESIKRLGTRLGDGILRNLNRLEEQPLGPLTIKRVAFDVPFRSFIGPDAPPILKGERRYLLETIDLWRQSTVARLSLGPRVHLLSFEPGEVLVDYQLYAQSLIPEHFLATASFGNGVYLYIPTRAAFEENGGYETSEGACVVTPEIDEALREALRNCFDEISNGPDVF